MTENIAGIALPFTILCVAVDLLRPDAAVHDELHQPRVPS